MNSFPLSSTVRLWPIAFSLSLLLLPACTRRETDVEAGIRTQTLLVGNRAEPQDLDPHITSGVPESNIERALFEGLVVQDPATGQPAPGVAHSWEVSADRLTYTFHLRTEARWSDGRPVTADDFVRSAQRLLNPALGAERVESFFLVAGVRAYVKGPERDFSRVGIRALDPLTLQVTLAEPVMHFFNKLFGVGWLPVPVEVLARHDGMEKRGSPWTRPGNLVGNGPFVLSAWKPNAYIEVSRSPTYWDRENVRLKRIRFLPIEDAGTEERMFRADQLHKTNTLPPSKIEVWRRDDPRVLQVESVQGTATVVLNPTQPPFSDPRVRRALALAIDRDRLAQVVGAGRTPARNTTPPNRIDYAPADAFRDDPAEARRLLAEAGFPGGRGLPRGEIIFCDIDETRLALEVVQEMWRKQLGIDVRLAKQEWGVWINSQKTGQYHLITDGWRADYPQFFFDLHGTGNPLSYYLWSSADYDRLLRSASAAASIPERNALYAQLEAILAREMPAIPLYFNAVAFLKHPAVRGWPESPDYSTSWKQVWLEK
jgi:oligopeptide transport system substrate-binding protein